MVKIIKKDTLNTDTPDPEFKTKAPKGPVRVALENMKAADAVAAIEPEFKPIASNEWRTTKEWWANATEDERQDQIYGLSFLNAAKPKQIAHYYSIKESDLKPYAEQWEMGNAARILKINGHQMRWGLSTNIPNAKFFLGLQFAGQVQNPMHEDVKSIEENKEQSLTINVIGKDGSISSGLAGLTIDNFVTSPIKYEVQ